MDVLDVVEVLVVEEMRHAAVIGADMPGLPSVEDGVPFATRYGYVLLPVERRGPVDDGTWGLDEDSWSPTGDGGEG